MDELMFKRFYKQFPDENSCLSYLKAIRWPDGAVCPHCEATKIYTYKDSLLYKCATCKKQFSAKVGTAFTNSHIPLQDWFLAIQLILANKSITSIQLAYYLDTTQKTAWSLQHRLQTVLLYPTFDETLRQMSLTKLNLVR